MAKAPRRQDLLARLGCDGDPPLLDEALTHPSSTGPARPHYQRLEFLGDRVLGLVIAEALWRRYPDENEGRLALRFNDLVRRETLASVAGEIDLGRHLLIDGLSAGAGARKRETILADAMEAVIAAVYLHAGVDAARAAVLALWGARLDAQIEAPQDAKSALQEWAAARGLPPPAYETVARTGPDHKPRFTIAARLATGAEAQATASSKRLAEQAAASALLKEVGHDR
jgi:ribonuclease-3